MNNEMVEVLRDELLEIGKKMHLFNPVQYDSAGYFVTDDFEENTKNIVGDESWEEYSKLKRNRIEISNKIQSWRKVNATDAAIYNKRGYLCAESFDDHSLKLFKNQKPISFKIEGQLYVMEFPSMSYQRMIAFLQRSAILDLGISTFDFSGRFMQIYGRVLNGKQKDLVGGWFTFHKEIYDFLDVTEEYPVKTIDAAYEMGALVFNTPDEDRVTITDERIKRKAEIFKSASNPKNQMLSADFFLQSAYGVRAALSKLPIENTRSSLIQQLKRFSQY